MQRISVVPDPASMGQTITICFNAGGISPAPTSVVVTISDGLGRSTAVTIPIDAGTHGGCVDFDLAGGDWPGAGGLQFSNPWSDAKAILIQ